MTVHHSVGQNQFHIVFLLQILSLQLSPLETEVFALIHFIVSKDLRNITDGGQQTFRIHKTSHLIWYTVYISGKRRYNRRIAIVHLCTLPLCACLFHFHTNHFLFTLHLIQTDGRENLFLHQTLYTFSLIICHFQLSLSLLIVRFSFFDGLRIIFRTQTEQRLSFLDEFSFVHQYLFYKAFHFRLYFYKLDSLDIGHIRPRQFNRGRLQ